ncbi:PAS domain S-box protein [Melittangium boletus]|uniref:histidine kinase n=1 Tax=Melittangium boletus DSM 14713 TaxID=1294270 RepID=A0A250IDU6_9BACT|nr:PAS domain S-box protein [Melittangium boletus]ATB29398.1 PAS domain-containing sensor histidine kinase [Melittangium boletus DSM 14713]
MSLHAFTTFWHRFLSVRWLIPILLVIAASSFGLFTLKSDVAQGDLQTEQQAVAEMTLQMTYLQGTLERLLRMGDLPAVSEEVAALGSNAALRQGVLIDERQKVVASIRLAQRGRAVHEAWPELTRPQHTQRMQHARVRMAGSVHVSEDGQQVMGYYPVTLQTSHRGDKVGMLVLQQDLTSNKLARRAAAERWAARSCLVMGVLAGLLGLVVHVVLGRRIQRLVSTAHRLAQGELHARAGLRGVDEIGLLGRAFDHMAEQVDRGNQQLQESQERIRALLDSTAEAIFGLDLEGRCTFCNRAALRLSGHEHAEALLGRSLHSIIHPQGDEPSDCRVCEAFREENAVHGDDELIRRAQGSDVPVEYWSHPVSRSGERVGSVVTFVDIGERKRAESTRRRMEEGFRTLIEHSPDAIFLHRAGTLLFANRAAATLLGHASPEPLRGLPVSELVLPGEEGALTVTSHAGVAREARFRHHEGRQAVGEVMTVSLVFEGLPTVASITRDITERRQVQERMLATERMVSLGTLAAGVAHEINNPLAYMLSNLHFVDTEVRTLAQSAEAFSGDQGREIQQALREAIDGGNRVRDIVRDLKTFSRGGDDKRSPVDIHTVLDSCANMARSEIRHRARLVKNYGAVPPVYANDSRLGQLFLNLLVNAAQAIPHGNATLNEIRVTTMMSGRQVLVEIQDTGVGIPPENLTRLFDPFFTTKPVGVGTGLGLSICHGIVTAQGGRISVESRPNQGSTFRVLLPALETPLEAVRAEPERVAS